MLLTESGIVQLRNNLLESNGNIFTFRCACLPLDIETGNGRVYPTDVVSKALIEARQPMINNELACTCNDHPEEINPIPRDISHVVKDAWIDNGYVYMTAEIVETQSGKDLKALIESNIPIGISVRGTGDVVGNKVTNYTYLGADFVATLVLDYEYILNAYLANAQYMKVKKSLNHKELKECLTYRQKT